MQIRDGRGPTFRFIARYGAQDAHEHGGIGHAHPLGKGAHRHGQPAKVLRSWRKDAEEARTLRAAI